MKKAIIQIIAASLWGFVVMYLVLRTGFGFSIPLSAWSFEITLVLLGMTIILMLTSLVIYLKIHREMKKQVTGEEEDEREAKAYNYFNNLILTNIASIYLSVASLAIGIITNQSVILVNISLVLVFLGMILSAVFMEVKKKIHPHRGLPSIGDRRYAKKIFEVSDEGERHIMLQGLYYTFSNMNVLLLVGVFILIIYSIISGVSQLFGILLILGILLITNMQYMIKIRNK